MRREVAGAERRTRASRAGVQQAGARARPRAGRRGRFRARARTREGRRAEAEDTRRRPRGVAPPSASGQTTPATPRDNCRNSRCARPPEPGAVAAPAPAPAARTRLRREPSRDVRGPVVHQHPAPVEQVGARVSPHAGVLPSIHCLFMVRALPTYRVGAPSIVKGPATSAGARWRSLANTVARKR